jgi:DNA-binding response OmpR family regulator
VQKSCLILVVDDDPAIREIVTEILELDDYTVQTATDGEAALRALARTAPGLVLLDMRMPVMDGWAFARELRARGDTTPIIVMTAAQDARVWAEEIQANGYLAKPFELTELLAVVDRLCS